ncbi:MAG: hypothetical protein WCF18_17630 [Chthoniobacteraceae bacterium]
MNLPSRNRSTGQVTALFRRLCTEETSPEAVGPDGSPFDPDGDKSSLANFADAFAGMVAGMEQRFVPLGGDLSAIVRHLQMLAATADDGFGTIRREISSGSLGDLDVQADTALTALKRRLGSIAERMAPLGEVADELHRLRSLGREVHHIGAFLQVCGSAFAIESARREESRAAFSSFVQELRGLAAQIRLLAERMDNDSGQTLAQLTAAQRRIAKDVAELQSLAKSIHGAFATAASEIRDFLGRLREVLDRVEGHRAAIGAQTGAVIYYLQFGDLVRQKCEHVLTAAREAEAPGDDSPQETQSITVRTSAAQLELIQREVDEAADRLSEGYAGLRRELAQLADCGKALSAGADAGDDDSWARVKARLIDIEGIQQKEGQLNLAAIRTAGEAGAAAAALQAGLGGVGEVSSHLHLLAVNAIIQTIHLGAHGRTLEELAQHVDSLHRTCDTLVPQILNLLEGVARRVARFDTEPGEPGLLCLEGFRQLESAQTSSHQVMQRVLGLASAGENMLDAAVHRLATLRELSAEIGSHRAALVAIASRLPSYTAASSAAADAVDSRMLTRYTMQSERDAHQRARGIELPPSETADIEFFSGPTADVPEDPALATATAGDGDLGDNVELF